MAFQVNNLQEAMRIDSSGNVGINTTDVSAIFEVLATAPTYTNNGTVFWGGTTNNDSHTGISLNSSGDALFGSVGSNIYYSNSATAAQSNTSRSSGEIQFSNTTTSSVTSSILFGGYVKGSTTFTEHMRIDTSGNLLVGTSSASIAATNNTGAVIVPNGASQFSRNGGHALDINRTQDGEIIRFRSAGNIEGSISISGSTTTYNTSSDQRLKENIADADDAGSKIDAIQVRKFDWIADGSHQDYGMIAQELQAVAPEAVSGDADSDDMMGVDYSKLVPMLVKEIQSLRARVQQLENN
jgi:hypothetical protein